MASTWRMKVNGVPTRRPHYGDTPNNEIVSNGASYMPAEPATPEQAYGGSVVVLGHRGMVSMSADPQMANYLPTEQVPSRWAPPVAGNVLVPVLTNNLPPTGPHNPQTSPIHIPVPISGPRGLSASRVLQLNQGSHGRRGRTGLANPTPLVRPKFRLRGGGVSS
jgi:hypothetical protein